MQTISTDFILLSKDFTEMTYKAHSTEKPHEFHSPNNAPFLLKSTYPLLLSVCVQSEVSRTQDLI
jgi:hypothetical protein